MQSNLEDMELFWPKSGLTDNFKLSAMPAADSRIKKNIWHPFCWKCQPQSGEWSTSLTSLGADTDHKPLVNLGAVHTKALSQIQEAMIKYDFEIMYQKGSEMPADFLSRNVVSQLRQKCINSLQFEDQDFELEQNKEPWIKEIKDWMTNGSECKTPTAISYMKIIGTIDFSLKKDYSGSESKSEENQRECVWSCQVTKLKKFWETVMEPCLPVTKEWTKQKPDYNKTIGGRIWIRQSRTSSRLVTNVRKLEQMFTRNQTC